MRDSRYTKTPAPVSLNEAFTGLSEQDNNVATIIARDTARQDPEAAEMPYNETTDQGLASRRSKHMMRDHKEVEAAYSGELAVGYGLSCRAPMAGQCENDQFPYQTDKFGKQRS